MNDRDLVTGATGFTGRALCLALRRRGREVVALVRDPSRAEDLRAAGVEIREADVRDDDAVRAAFEPFARVFHIAAAFRTEHSRLAEFRAVNVEGTRNVLAAARAAGVGRFVHCSTVGVQGHIAEPPAAEDYRFSPGDHYQQSKLEGELLAREAFAAGLPGTVVRPVGIYGPGDTRFLKLFRPIARGHFVMIGSGRHFYHLTHIDDLVDGFLLAAERPEALGEVFTLGGAEYTTVKELVDRIARALGVPPPHLRIPYWPVHVAAAVCQTLCGAVRVPPPLYPRRVEFFAKSRAFSIEKARRRLGYEPKVALDDGLRRTAAWYREQGLL